MSKIGKKNLSREETFQKTQEHLIAFIERENQKEHPNLNLLAAYAALGQCLCEIEDLVKCKVAITLSISVEENSDGHNLVLMLGNQDLIEKNNDLLIQGIQQEIIQEMHEGGNQ